MEPDEPSPSRAQLVAQDLNALKFPEASLYKWPDYCIINIQNVPE